MKFKFVDFNSKDYKKLLDLRITVFCHEQNIDLSLEREHEKDSIYMVVVTKFNKIVSGARYRKTGEGYKLERMLTTKKYRNKGYGAFLVNNFIAYARQNNLSPLYLYAQKNALPFYEKLGFTKIGAEFLEANIIHQKMVYQLIID